LPHNAVPFILAMGENQIKGTLKWRSKCVSGKLCECGENLPTQPRGGTVKALEGGTRSGYEDKEGLNLRLKD